MNDLERTIQWMKVVVRHPQGSEKGRRSEAARSLFPDAADAPETVVLPSSRMSSAERVDVYRRLFLGNLQSHFQNFYPGLNVLLGTARLHQLVALHAERRPSGTPLMQAYALDFSKTLEEVLLGREPSSLHFQGQASVPREFVVDLAQLESRLRRLAQLAYVSALETDPLRELGVEDWLRARFLLVDAAEVVKFPFPVARFLQSVQDGVPCTELAAEPEWVLVYRTGWRTGCRSLPEPAAVLLRSLKEGRTLAEALERVLELEDVRTESLMEDLGAWFTDWSSRRIFQGVELAKS